MQRLQNLPLLRSRPAQKRPRRARLKALARASQAAQSTEICRGVFQMVKHSDNAVKLFGNLLQCFKFLTFPCIAFDRANAFRERSYLPIIIFPFNHCFLPIFTHDTRFNFLF